MKKRIIIITTVFILAILAAGFWTYTAFFYTTPLTQQELKHLTPDWTKATHGNWSPWYTDPDGTKTWNPAASFNAFLETIPGQDKAWPVLVDVWYGNLDLYLNENISSYPQELRDWNSFADTIRTESSQTIIDRISEALNRPYMGCGLYAGTDQIEHDARIRYFNEDSDWQPNQRTDPPLSILWQSSLSSHRSSTHWLQSGAIVALLDGDSDRFVSLHETILNSAHLSNEYPNLISQLVYMAIVAEGAESIRWAIQYHPDKLSNADLTRLDQALAPHANMKFQWEGEAFIIHDAFRRMGGTDGRLSLKEQLGKMAGSGLPVTGLASNLPDSKLDSSIARPLMVYNGMLAHTSTNSDIPWLEFSESTESLFQEQITTLNSISSIMLDILAPSFDKSAQRFQQSRQEIAATRVAISIFKYKEDLGKFPQTVADLDIDSNYCLDEFTGNPLLFTISQTGLIVYSVGNNLQDDHGVQTDERRPRWLSIPRARQIMSTDPESIAGDFIYFPNPPMTVKDDDYDEEWERKTYGDD